MLVTGTTPYDADWKTQPFAGNQASGESDPDVSANLFPMDSFVAANIEAGLQASTISTYLRDIHQYFAWLRESHREYDEINTNDLVVYLEYLAELDGRPNQNSRRRYSPSTLKRKLSSIRRFYRVMISIGVMVKNPALGIHAAKIITDTPRQSSRPLSIKQTRELLSQPDLTTPKGYRDRAMLALMALTGLESFEVHLLNAGDYLKAEGCLQVTGRASKQRALYLPEYTAEVLLSWLNVRQLLDPPTSAMFISMHWSNGRALPHNRISTRAIYEIVRSGLDAIGIERDGHCTRILRTTFASLLLENGATLEELRLVLGTKPKSYSVLQRLSIKI